MIVEVITMANSNNFSKTNAQQVRKQNQQSAAGQGQFGTEFASETNAQQVRKQNQQSAGQQGQFGTEFASETDAQQVRQQNQSAEQNKQQNS
jgi:small acid-soluble spore protein E (minor gamma-type SASP)